MTLSDMNFIACFRGMNHKSKSLKGHFFNNKLTENDIQIKSDETARLLNKPYVNEVTLRGQK